MKAVWFLVGFSVTVALMVSLSGCVEEREVLFTGVDYVQCTKSHKIKNPDCFSSESDPKNKDKRNSCEDSPIVTACMEWIVSGGHATCGAFLNCNGVSK
jgi:hypothetical protein